MMRSLFAALIALTVATAASGERRISLDAGLRIDNAANAAVDVADQFSDAIAAGDLDAAKNLLAEDVLVLESGGVERSRDEYFAHHAAADAKFLAGSTQTIKHRTARADKRSVWIATHSEIKTADGRLVQSTETLVLEKRKDGWKIVHIHWSSR